MSQETVFQCAAYRFAAPQEMVAPMLARIVQAPIRYAITLALADTEPGEPVYLSVMACDSMLNAYAAIERGDPMPEIEPDPAPDPALQPAIGAGGSRAGGGTRTPF